jgi:hypothetical protein
MTHCNPLLLSDAALEECVDGATDPRLLREILRQPAVVTLSKKVSIMEFAKQFQMALEDLAEDDQANKNNYQWGMTIADTINAATFQKPKDEVTPQDAWPKPKRPKR